jgi:SAM-dependent methyltransferase
MNTYLKFDDNILKKRINKSKFKWLADICKTLEINPNHSRVIDLGSGHGQNTIALSHHFYKVYGVEPSTKMLKFSRKLKKKSERWYNLSGLRFYKGDFEKIPIKQVNIICLFNSIHFSSRVIQDLSNILSNICKNGLLVISEPHNKSIFGSKKLMDDKKALKQKLKILKRVRQKIKIFLKDCQKNKKASIIKEEETERRYFVIIQKK